MTMSTYFVRVLEEDSPKLLVYCAINNIMAAYYSVARVDGINTVLYIINTDRCAVTALKLACRLVGITKPLYSNTLTEEIS